MFIKIMPCLVDYLYLYPNVSVDFTGLIKLLSHVLRGIYIYKQGKSVKLLDFLHGVRVAFSPQQMEHNTSLLFAS